MKKLNQDNWQEMFSTSFKITLKDVDEVVAKSVVTGNDICRRFPVFVAVVTWEVFSTGMPVTVNNEETTTLTVEVVK